MSELWRATAVVLRVKPNIHIPKARTPAGVSEGGGGSPSFPPSSKGRCYKQRAGDKLTEISLGTGRGCMWPGFLPMGSFTMKEIMAEGWEPFQNHLAI